LNATVKWLNEVWPVTLLGYLILTQSQIQGSTDINTLSDVVTDCHRFVTEFFEVISQSAPHIYHSALHLAPRSSIIGKLYSQQMYSPRARVVTGVPASWDSCTASASVTERVFHAVWSPCSQFIATILGSIIQVWNSSTLERVSVFKPPSSLSGANLILPAFSPDGCLLACICTKWGDPFH